MKNKRWSISLKRRNKLKEDYHQLIVSLCRVIWGEGEANSKVITQMKLMRSLFLQKGEGAEELGMILIR
jgi:hypothetical protein